MRTLPALAVALAALGPAPAMANFFDFLRGSVPPVRASGHPFGVCVENLSAGAALRVRVQLTQVNGPVAISEWITTDPRTPRGCVTQRSVLEVTRMQVEAEIRSDGGGWQPLRQCSFTVASPLVNRSYALRAAQDAGGLACSLN